MQYSVFRQELGVRNRSWVIEAESEEDAIRKALMTNPDCEEFDQINVQMENVAPATTTD